MDATNVPALDVVDTQHNHLEDVGLVDFLEQDDRPSYVIDLEKAQDSSPIYYNPALIKNEATKARIAGLSKLHIVPDANRPQSDWTFAKWQRSADAGGHSQSSRYAGSFWIATTVSRRWRVISRVLTVQNIVHEDAFPTIESLHVKSVNLATEEAQTTTATCNERGHDSTYTGGLGLKRKPSSLSSQNQISSAPRSPDPPAVASNLETEDRILTQEWAGAQEKLSPFDWTVPDSSVAVTPYVRWFRNFDWSSTSLGRIETWTPDLRTIILHLLADPRCSALHWGNDKTMVYNEAYANGVMGSKHPSMLGKPFGEAWAELGDAFDQIFARAETFGEATKLDDACFFLEFEGKRLEQRFFHISMIPVVGTDQKTIGFYNPVVETTRQVVAERRMKFLLKLGVLIAASRQPQDFWINLLNGLHLNVDEAPFAMLYSADISTDDTASSTSESNASLKHWVLEGKVGYPLESSLPQRLKPDTTESFLPSFRELIKADSPVLLQRSDGSLPNNLVDGIVSRGFGDICDSAVFIPIRSTGENVLGFLMLGVNPRCTYNADYQVFVQLLFRQLATSMASAVLVEDEIRRSKLAAQMAMLDRNELSEKLAITSHMANESEHRFRRMADLAPVAMFYFDASGMPIYCNDNWYLMTEHPRDVEYPMSWYNVIHPDDHPAMDVEWARLGAGLPVSFEIRLNKEFSAAEIVGGESVRGQSWILLAAYPEKSADGTVVAILGCLTDISRQKWAEDFQNRRMKEALELKRQQENFIDMTSHEMRNPLSAIVQCADWISNSLAEYDTATKNVVIPAELVDSHLDAAQTIVLCAQHQKRIIDDVLTLSKLDSNLLLITPVDVQPAVVIADALRMFEGELQKNDVDFRFNIDDSFHELQVDWVKLDPSRIVQVLINLVTNAIKFTQPEAKRSITVAMGASLERPTVLNSIEFLPRNPNQLDLTDKPEWGTGKPIYLQIQVEDTGRGLDEQERKLLFQRFSQTSPRTHVQYGGSGLGLFISRELTELQGGEIGMKSTAGVGSTFAFFVKARRAVPHKLAAERQPALPHRSSAGVATQPGGVPTRIASPTVPVRTQRPKVTDATRHVLVVEDNLVNQKVLTKQLRSAGCIVSVANHGQEALSFLQQSNFWAGNLMGKPLDIVLMDLEMPIMDGLTCVKEIRRLQRRGLILGHVPVIAVTANARSEQIATAKETGMDGVVTKPFRIPELIPEMERLVTKMSQRTVLERSSSAPVTPLT